MAHRAVALCISVLVFVQKGHTALMQTQQTVMAAVGDCASLSCQLVKSKEVHQVTWQKILADGERNVATFNRYSGSNVNPDFKGKVELIEAGLQNSSIMIKQVTQQDEGCYHCLFNTYPDGALICSTCLQLYELHGPVLHVRESNSSEEAVVSCSATARPSLTVTLRVQDQRLNSSTHSYNQLNGTVTVSTTAVVQRRSDNSEQVECVAEVPHVPPKVVSETIPAVTKSSHEARKEELESDDKSHSWVPAVCVVTVLLALGLLFLLVWRLRKSRSPADPEEIKTPLRSSVDTHTTSRPLIQREQELKQRMSSVKKGEKDRLKASSPKERCKRQLSQLFCHADETSPPKFLNL